MATRVRKANALLFDDRADVPNRNTVEAFPAKQVTRIVGAILAMVWDGVLVLHLLVGHRLRVRFNRDKMIDNGDSVELPEYCFSVREVLGTVVRGNNTDGLNEFLGIFGAQRFGKVCRLISALFVFPLINSRVMHEIERTLRRWTGAPEVVYSRGRFGGRKLEVRHSQRTGLDSRYT